MIRMHVAVRKNREKIDMLVADGAKFSGQIHYKL
jgi:hypothetical protein